MFFPSLEDQDTDKNPATRSKGTIDYSVPPLCDDQLRLWLQNALIFSADYMSTEDDHAHDDHLLDFEVSSSQKLHRGENLCLEDNILHGFDDGRSTGAERTHVSNSLEMQRNDSHEAGTREDLDCRQQKRTRSTEVHNSSERLRRQKLAEKIKALQEMIPNSNKMDQASTIDEAIKYIKALQYQVQMMLIGAGYTMSHSPLTMMMMPQPGQQGIQIPCFAPFLQTVLGMKYGIEMGMSGVFPSFNFPMSQLGLPNPCLLPLSSTSGLPPPAGGISVAAHSIQNSGNFLEPLHTTSLPFEPNQTSEEENSYSIKRC